MSDIVNPGMAGFITREDEALKNLLKGITVEDGGSPKRVGVWFSQPDPEIRAAQYPFITIDLIDVDEARERVMNSYGPVTNRPKGVPADSVDVVYRTYYPTPINLTYQITSWARHPRQDRQILAQLNYDAMHPRFSQLYVADDNTARRLVVTGFTKRDSTEDQRRLYRNIWTVQVSSEVYYFPIDEIRRVKSVRINTGNAPPSENIVFTPPAAGYRFP